MADMRVSVDRRRVSVQAQAKQDKQVKRDKNVLSLTLPRRAPQNASQITIN